MSLVVLVGRPNVGKSTLFNRLVESQQAIMYEQPGITRDRQYGEVEWCGRSFVLIDTGGYIEQDIDRWTTPIRKQILIALQEADLLLFVLDCKTGLLAEDYAVAHLLRRISKPVLLVANKADNAAMSMEATSFHALGLGEGLFEVSAVSGAGTGDLLDAAAAQLPAQATHTEQAPLPRVAILGRPNVGKSMLLNVLVGEERSIVSEQAGTTRDALTVHYKHFGKELLLIDTAGVRKRAKVKEKVEFFSILRALSALQNCDICVLVLDAQLGLEAQDLHLLSLAHRYHKGIVLCVNKWDLIDKDTHTQQQWKKRLHSELGALAYVQICFCSALDKQGVYQLLERAVEVHTSRQQHIPTARLNEHILPVIARTPPPTYKGKPIRIKYITQLKKPYPHFVFFANLPQHVTPSYIRFMMRTLREHFGFAGVPLVLSFRRK